MSITKRKDIRSRRAQKRLKQRRNTLIIVGVVALVVVAVIALASYVQSNAPVEGVVLITPVARPQANGLAAGDPNAPVRLDLYEDFQCSACKTFTEYIETQVMNELVASGQVYYVFHNYPFMDNWSDLKESDQAAHAAMCAAEQNRFWDYHDIIFANYGGENEGGLTDARLISFADALNLDMGDFRACYQERRYAAEIDKDISLGESLEVSGTPTVFINGVVVRPGYVPSYEDIKAAVDAALAGN